MKINVKLNLSKEEIDLLTSYRLKCFMDYIEKNYKPNKDSEV